MEVIEIKENRTLNGFTIRTRNSNEIDQSTAKIGPIWERFYKEIAPSLKNGSEVYGLYSNYESDASGVFDLSACTDQEVSNTQSVILQKGKYLVFSRRGTMPQVVIDVWGEIWNYFSSDDKFERAYLTDFELYKNDQEVEVYIGIKDN